MSNFDETLPTPLCVKRSASTFVQDFLSETPMENLIRANNPDDGGGGGKDGMREWTIEDILNVREILMNRQPVQEHLEPMPLLAKFPSPRPSVSNYFSEEFIEIGEPDESNAPVVLRENGENKCSFCVVS